MNDETLKTQQFQPSQPDPDGGTSPRLVTLEGLRVGLAYPLTSDRTQIGRLEDNDLVLASRPVSKRHAAVVREQGLFFIEDLNSTNGVIVNESRLSVDTRRRLYHGDSIRISDHLFMFRQETSFVDGMSNIQLDHSKIDAEAREFIDDWKRTGRTSKPARGK